MKWKKLMLVSFFILSLVCGLGGVQSIPLFDSDAVTFGVENENYTLKSDTTSLSGVYVADSWIRFNNTDFNITSSNPINITVSYLDDNILTASAGDTVLSFSADSSGGLVYFNLSGFSPSMVYTLYRDDAVVSAYTADSNGNLNFTNDVWSDHDFDLLEGSFDGSRTVKVDYERSSIAGISSDSYGVLSLMPVIALVVVAAAILVLITRKEEL